MPKDGYLASASKVSSEVEKEFISMNFTSARDMVVSGVWCVLALAERDHVRDPKGGDVLM